MPLLNRRTSGPGLVGQREMGLIEAGMESGMEPGLSEPVPGVWKGIGASRRPGLFETCANPNCRSGWLHLWRSRSAPMFEGGWNCSAECTAARVQAAVRRELDGRGRVRESHRHRIPLGLVMLEQGWITQTQLRQALDAQKAAGTGRLGHWLVRQSAVSEQIVTRALGCSGARRFCPWRRTMPRHSPP